MHGTGKRRFVSRTASYIVLVLFLSVPQLVVAQNQLSISKGLLDPDARFSSQSITLAEFRTLLNGQDGALADAEARLMAMDLGALEIDYREGKLIDDSRKQGVLTIEATRKLIASVRRDDSLRKEFQLVLSLKAVDSELDGLNSSLSNEIFQYQSTKSTEARLDWARQIEQLQEKLVSTQPRIVFYVLAQAEHLAHRTEQ